MDKRHPTGPARAFEGMATKTTVAQHTAEIRRAIDALRVSWDHNNGGGGIRSSRSAQLAVRQELGIDGGWPVIFDELVVRAVKGTPAREGGQG
jgi:hypothetical protein